jgi:hypothetical protein
VGPAVDHLDSERQRHTLVRHASQGGMLFVREGINIRVFDSGQDNSIKERREDPPERVAGRCWSRTSHAFAYIPLSFST